MTLSEARKLAPTLAVRLSGTGGQGLVLMGHLLAEALALQEGLNVVQTKSYGPEARGGASRSDVVLSTGQIDDLGGLPIDILICLSQQACDKYFPALVPHGLLLVDSTNVKVVPTSRVVEVPLTEMAMEACGTKMVANVVALGMLSGYSNVVQLPSLKAAVEHGVKPAFRDLNNKALDTGYKMATRMLREMEPRHVSDVRNYSARNLPHAAIPGQRKVKKTVKVPAKS